MKWRAIFKRCCEINQLLMFMGYLHCLLVAGPCAPVRSMSVIVKDANSFLFQKFSVFSLEQYC